MSDWGQLSGIVSTKVSKKVSVLDILNSYLEVGRSPLITKAYQESGINHIEFTVDFLGSGIQCAKDIDNFSKAIKFKDPSARIELHIHYKAF